MIRGRRARWLSVGVLVLVVLLLMLRWLAAPDHVAGLVLGALGDTLGLEITATGTADYRLRGTPSLVLRNVVAREPGAATPLLRAQRVFVSVPWSTVRSRGAQLDITRIEIDAPRLDVAALQHWLATRPSGDSRLPTLREGFALRGGRIDGDGWRLEGLTIALLRLVRDARVEAALAGRLVTDATTLAFRVNAAMTRPANDAGVALLGPVSVEARGAHVAGWLQASGPLHVGDDGIRIARLRSVLSGRYDAGDVRLPATIAIVSPLRYGAGTLALSPIGIALRGSEASPGPVPHLDAGGTIESGRDLDVRLDGRIAAWPATWPALPPPIGASASPLPFALRYAGKPDLSDEVHLQLQRDTTRFDGRFRVADVTAWATAPTAASPIPPLRGRIETPRVDISGAQLEGVDVVIEDDAPAAAPTPEHP